MPNPPETKPVRPLKLLSVVIPARDEEGCIASTIEHLHLELSLRGLPHKIVVIDDGPVF
jgi:dolichol-phosphate mannosyltransferase